LEAAFSIATTHAAFTGAGPALPLRFFLISIATAQLSFVIAMQRLSAVALLIVIARTFRRLVAPPARWVRSKSRITIAKGFFALGWRTLALVVIRIG
jgi:hypothetical protein